MTMTIDTSSAAFHAPADLPADSRRQRSLLRRLIDALMEGRRRRAARDVAEHLHRHQDPRDDFRIELERRFMGQ
jgi:hypothetical protein